MHFLEKPVKLVEIKQVKKEPTKLQVSLEVSPFLDEVPSVLDAGERLKALLEKKEDYLRELDHALLSKTYSNDLLVALHLLDQELQSLYGTMFVRSDDTELGRSYNEYKHQLLRSVPKGDLLYLEESLKKAQLPFVDSTVPYYKEYEELLEAAVSVGSDLFVEVQFQNNFVALYYEFGQFTRAVSLDEGRIGLDCTSLVRPYLVKHDLLQLPKLRQVAKNVITGYLYTPICEGDLTPSVSYTKLNLSSAILSSLRFYAYDYVEYGMTFGNREQEYEYLVSLGFVGLPYVRYTLDRELSLSEVISDWVDILNSLSDISCLSSHLRVSVVSAFYENFREVGLDSIRVSPLAWLVKPKRAKLQYVRWQQELNGLKPFAVISYPDITIDYEVGGEFYSGFYSLAEGCPQFEEISFDLSEFVVSRKDLGVELEGTLVTDIPLENPLNLFLLDLKPEYSIYFWSAPQLGLFKVCDQYGRILSQFLR